MIEELEANEEREASSRALVCRSRVDSLEGRFGSFILGAIDESTSSICLRFEVDLEGRYVDTREMEKKGCRHRIEMGECRLNHLMASSYVDMSHVDMSHVDMSNVDIWGIQCQRENAMSTLIFW